MYFNAFLAKTLLLMGSGEWGDEGAGGEELITNAQFPMPNAQFSIPFFTSSLIFDLNRWTFKNIMKVYLSLLVFNS
jgi:hypothetical protein